MKKRLLIAGFSVMLCLLGGCLEATPLNDEEMDAAAEYAASLLLKFDKNYDTPLYYAEEREIRLTPTPTPEPTVKATPTPTPVAGGDTSAGNASSEGSMAKPTATPIPTPTPFMFHEAETSKQLTEIIAVENITVTCEGWVPMKSVQSTEYFSMAAKEGRQYVVVNFLLHNNTEEDIIFDASENGLEYSIDINTNDISRVSLSVLENDMQYMEIPVPANGTAEAVLVFEIADTEINTMHLIIENSTDETVFAKLK